MAINFSSSLRLEVTLANNSIVSPRKWHRDGLPCCFYKLSSQFIELHILRFLRSCLFINISIFAFFAWMTGFQMSERSSRSVKIRLIFKLCFQRKRRNLEITDYLKQIPHIAGVNSIQGKFNLPGVFISLNIIYISNESLVEYLSLNFIKKKKKGKRKENFNFMPAGLLVFTK